MFELILPMFAARKPRRTSSPFKVILTEEKDIICFHGQRNKILAAKLQMFFDFAIQIRSFARTKRRSILPKGRFTKIIRRFAVSKMSICRNRVSICGVFVGSSRVGSRFSGLFCELSASFYRFLSH